MQGGEHQTRSQGARVRVPAHWVNLGKVRLSIYKMRALDSMTDYLIIAMTRILNSPGPPPPLASQPSKGNKQYENKVLPGRWPQARSRTKAPCTIPAHGSFLRSLNHTTVTDYETASKFSLSVASCLMLRQNRGFPLQMSISYVNLLLTLRWVMSLHQSA